MILNLSQYSNLVVVAVVLAILAKLVVILKLELRSISKKITNLIFLNIYIPPQHALTHKIIDKANSKFDLIIKEALHVNSRKPNLNAQQNHLALTLSLQLLLPFLLSAFVCFLFVVLHFSFIYGFRYLYGNYRFLVIDFIITM